MRLPRIAGPILFWELTVIPRRRWFFILRCVYVAILFLFFWSIFESSLGSRWYRSSMIRSVQHFADAFFSAFVSIQITAVLFLGPALTASAIVREKERKTIEYLFVSDLFNSEIVLGKWLARLAEAVGFILAGLPVLSFASWFGGVDPIHVWLATLFCLALLFFTTSLAILISIHAKNTRAAIQGAILIVVLVVVFPIVFASIGIQLSGLATMPYAILLITALNPYVTWFQFQQGLTQSSQAVSLEHLLTIIAGYLVFGSGFLAISVSRLRSVHAKGLAVLAKSKDMTNVIGGDAPNAKRGVSRRFSWVGWFAEKRFPDSPVGQREWSFGDGRRRTFLSRLGGLFLILCAYFNYFLPLFVDGPKEFHSWSGRMALAFVAFVTYFSVLSRSTNAIQNEKDRDCWVSLLCTPLSARAILYGKFFGALRPISDMVWILTPIWMIAMLVGHLFFFSVVLQVAVATVQASLVAAIGVSQSLRRKNSGTAFGAGLVITSLYFGIGHILTSPFFLILGMSNELGILWSSTVPWVGLTLSWFSWPELTQFLGESNDGGTFLLGVLLTLAAHLSISAYLLETAARDFNRLTERIE